MKNKDIFTSISIISSFSILLAIILLYSFGFDVYDLTNLLILRVYVISLFIVYSIYCYSKNYKTSLITEKFAEITERIIQKLFTNFTFRQSINGESGKTTLLLFATYMIFPLVLLVLFLILNIIKFINEFWFYIFSLMVLILIYIASVEKIKLLQKVVIILLLGGIIYTFSDLRYDSLSENITNLEDTFDLLNNYNSDE